MHPPPLLHGADPSKREEKEIYGLNFESVAELEAKWTFLRQITTIALLRERTNEVTAALLGAHHAGYPPRGWAG
jgi:hypothetical protein